MVEKDPAVHTCHGPNPPLSLCSVLSSHQEQEAAFSITQSNKEGMSGFDNEN